MWSLGNEVIADAKVPDYIPDTLKILVPFARKLDGSRPYTHACVSGWNDAPGLAALAAVEDIVGVNYQDFLFGAMHEKNPNAVIVGTEQDPYSVPGSNVPTWYAVRNTPYVVGHHLWTGVDYLGESKRTLGGESGFLDNCIFRKSCSIISKASGASRHGPYHHRQTARAMARHAGPGRELEPDRTGRRRHLPPIAKASISTSMTPRSGRKNRAILPKPGSCNGRKFRGKPV